MDIAAYEYAVKAKAKKAPALPPLTSEEWDKLSPKAKWDSIVALRGPDLKYSDTLKFFTTSVIRHRLSGVMRVGGMVNGRLPFVVIPHGLHSDGLFDVAHFLGHVQEAAQWLDIPVVTVPAAIGQLMLGHSNHADVIEQMQGLTTITASNKAALKASMVW